MDIGIQRETWVYLSSRFKRLALLLTLPTIEDRILEKKGSIPFVSKAINHRSECLAFVPCLIRHFSLVCLLAVLIFSPKVSFATTVQGTTAYSSSAEAQTQINTLITVVIAAHPGATQNGNAVQWVEDGRSVTRAWTIRGGLLTISKFTLRYYGGGEDVYSAPRFDFTLIGYDGFAALRNQALGMVPSILYNRPDDPNVVGDNSQLLNNPHAEPEDVYIAYDAYTSGVRWTTRMVINYGATTAVITPYYIDYQDTGSQLCPVLALTTPPFTDACSQALENLSSTQAQKYAACGTLTPAMQSGQTCLENKLATITPAAIPFARTADIRSVAYQAHFREIWEKMERLVALENDPVKRAACVARRAEIAAEKGCDSADACEGACYAPSATQRSHCLRGRPARPDPNGAKHTQGNAIDVSQDDTIDPLIEALAGRNPPQTIPQFLDAAPNCNLKWGGTFTDNVDEVHFEAR